jgi:hypothetical protein
LKHRSELTPTCETYTISAVDRDRQDHVAVGDVEKLQRDAAYPVARGKKGNERVH